MVKSNTSGSLFEIERLLDSLLDAVKSSDDEAQSALCLLHLLSGDDEFEYHQPRTSRVKAQLPDCYRRLARESYQQWLKKPLEFFPIKIKLIPEPGDRFLIDYLYFLKEQIELHLERRKYWILSCRSYISFLRLEHLQVGEISPLNRIFPERMEFVEDYEWGDPNRKVVRILQIPEKNAHPIDIWKYAKIIQNLLLDAQRGRIDRRCSTAEALGFSLLCLVAASNRLDLQEKQIFRLSLSSLESDGVGHCWIMMPSLDGERRIPIPQVLHDYLMAIPRAISHRNLFCRSMRVLRASFDRAVERTIGREAVGKVTFLTLLSLPHLAAGHPSFIK